MAAVRLLSAAMRIAMRMWYFCAEVPGCPLCPIARSRKRDNERQLEEVSID